MLPKIIDLFSGCGGLALGFEKAGFEFAGGIEIMPDAYKTNAYNLCWRYGKEEDHICGDITEIEGDIFNNRVGREGLICIGGPPCQAYSLAGRAKLRSLGEERINTKDARGHLYQDFLRFAFASNARAVVMENVPESVNYGGKNIPEIVCEELEAHDYTAYWTILNAADYGVPQVRERIFVIAIRTTEGRQVELPEPTHSSEVGYKPPGMRRIENFKKNKHFREPVLSNTVNRWINVKEAFSDLPELFPSVNSKYKTRAVNEELPYKSEPKNSYQNLMRTWYGVQTYGVTGNSFHKNKQAFTIIDHMDGGDNYIVASAIADKLLEEEANAYGFLKGSKEYEKLKSKIVPVYDRTSFTGKWMRLNENSPSYTVTAHLEKDAYSHLHPWEPRGISVREAARLQSFPDDFFFNCTMGSAYRQIGNAVPVLLAYGVAEALKKAFDGD